MVRPSKFCKFSCQQAAFFFAINLYLKRDLNCLQRNRASGWRPTRNTKYSERFVCGLWNVTIVVVQLSHSTLQSVTCRGVCSDRNNCIRQIRRSSFDCPHTRHTIALGGQSIKIDMWKPCYKSMTIASLGFILLYVLYLWINEISILRLWITRFRCYQLNQSRVVSFQSMGILTILSKSMISGTN